MDLSKPTVKWEVTAKKLAKKAIKTRDCYPSCCREFYPRKTRRDIRVSGR